MKYTVVIHDYRTGEIRRSGSLCPARVPSLYQITQE